MSKRTFLGIGAGPIQTGIFVAGAFRGGYERIVLADVDAKLVAEIRKYRTLTVNTAGRDAVRTDTYGNIEIYNPAVPEDLEILKNVAAEALAVNTALPATKFYASCAPWLAEAFERAPERTRYVYTSENSTTAAAELAAAAGRFPATYYLDTVIGKMSKIFRVGDNPYPGLTPDSDRGHLVEEFNIIHTGSAPGIASAGIAGLYPKDDLGPFEEAKLYGHNAAHMVLAVNAVRMGCANMDETAAYPEIVEDCRRALLEECGAALCRKYAGVDPYFEPENFRAWGNELVRRMTSPVLGDSVARVARDLNRKLGWNDRLIGAIRLCREQGVSCPRLLRAAANAARFQALDTIGGAWNGNGSAELLETLRRV